MICVKFALPTHGKYATQTAKDSPEMLGRRYLGALPQQFQVNYRAIVLLSEKCTVTYVITFVVEAFVKRKRSLNDVLLRLSLFDNGLLWASNPSIAVVFNFQLTRGLYDKPHYRGLDLPRLNVTAFHLRKNIRREPIKIQYCHSFANYTAGKLKNPAIPRLYGVRRCAAAI